MGDSPRTVLVVGGRGLIGNALIARLVERGDAVRATTRSDHPVAGATTLRWDPADPLPASALDGVDAIVNLAGEPIAPHRWTKRRMAAIRESRIGTTRRIVDGIVASGGKPALVSGSAIGYYPPSDEVIDVGSPPGTDFLARVCSKWEREALRAEEAGSRVVTVRTGLVLARRGGVFPLMVLPIRLFAGGPLGNGSQWVSWIHLDDEVGILLESIDGGSGPVNAVAPEPATQKDFTKRAAKILHRPSSLPAPAFVLHGALGDASRLLLDSHRIAAPARTFAYPGLDAALTDLLAGRARP